MNTKLIINEFSGISLLLKLFEYGVYGLSFDYLLHHQFFEPLKGFSYVCRLNLCYFLEYRIQLSKSCVFIIIEPRLDEDSILRLEREIISHIVNDDGLVKRPSYPAEVFQKCHPFGCCVFSIKPV